MYNSYVSSLWRNNPIDYLLDWSPIPNFSLTAHNIPISNAITNNNIHVAVNQSLWEQETNSFGRTYRFWFDCKAYSTMRGRELGLGSKYWSSRFNVECPFKSSSRQSHYDTLDLRVTFRGLCILVLSWWRTFSYRRHATYTFLCLIIGQLTVIKARPHDVFLT